MKVLSLTSSYPRFAGDPTAPFVESITRHVAALGHETHLVLPEHREWNRPDVEGRVHYHPYRYSPRRSWTPWGYSEALEGGVKIRRSLYALAPLVALSALRTCTRVASREAIELVHAHWVVPNGPIAALTARRRRCPLVISLHGSDIAVSERSGWMGRLARRSFARAQAVTAPSEDLLERAGRLGARGHLELVPYGADPDTFRPDAAAARHARRRLGLEPNEFAVFGIGRFAHVKGFDYLIEAIARAQEAVPEVRLVLVGDGDIREHLETRAEALGVAGSVTFAGMAAREDMPGYVGAADVVAVPSVRHEGYVDGLPNVALEAMAAGKPLIATRVGGLPQLVRDGEDGLLVDERDAGALADAIVRLARDSDLRSRMGDLGRARVVESLNWDAVARRFAEIYERVASRGLTPRV